MLVEFFIITLSKSTPMRISKNFVLLKTEVRPSQRTNTDFHKPLGLCSAVGTVKSRLFMHGGCMSCSHVCALLWNIEYAVRSRLADKRCTNEQVKWNKSTSRNLEPGVIIEMNFKKPNFTCKTEDIFDDENNNIQNLKSSFTMFTKQEELSFVEKSALKPLSHLKNLIIFRSVYSNIHCKMPTSLLNHSEHTGRNHVKSELSFMKGIYDRKSHKQISLKHVLQNKETQNYGTTVIE